ncbi:MAG: tetratricopeptide repeat protein [Acidimicrobiia bacterium]
MTAAEDHEPHASSPVPTSARTLSSLSGPIIAAFGGLVAVVLAAHETFGFRPSPVARALVLVTALLSACGALYVAINAIGPQRSRRWKLLVGSTAMVVSGLILGLVYITSDEPVAASADPIPGNLRIAVAPFQHRETGSDSTQVVAATRSLADRFAEDLREELDAVADPFQPGVEYRDIAVGEESDRGELERAARIVDAHIVVFGSVQTDEDHREATMQAYAYVSTLAVPRALEIAGSYPLGDPVEARGDFLAGDPIAEQAMQVELQQRVSDLARFSRGLLLFGSGDYVAADDAFASVERVWQSGNGQLVTLMRGAVALQQRRLDAAASSFRKILESEPDNGRALLGSAEVMLQRLLPTGPSCAVPSDVDVDVAELIGVYRRAREVGGAPGSYVMEKSVIGEGRARLYEGGDPSSAIELLDPVVSGLDGDEPSEALYMDARMTRGLLASRLGGSEDLERAASDLSAVDTNAPTTAAARWRLGQILVLLQRPDEAADALREAISLFQESLSAASPEQHGCLEQFRDAAQQELNGIGD